MIAATRLTPYIPPVPAQHAQTVAQSKKQSGLTAMVGMAGVLYGITTTQLLLGHRDPPRL
jgi:hypothetical protein